MNATSFFPDSELALEVLEEGQVSRKIRAHGGALMIVEVFFKAGGIGYEHCHVHEQVCYCLAGKFTFTLEGQAHTLHAGDSIFIPSNAVHGAVCIEEGRLLDVFTPQRTDFLAANV